MAASLEYSRVHTEAAWPPGLKADPKPSRVARVAREAVETEGMTVTQLLKVTDLALKHGPVDLDAWFDARCRIVSATMNGAGLRLV